jgi:Asp-tRNA(Asn)/Glu-tRNA(Gln) amidotransferase A subunit family amidase
MEAANRFAAEWFSFRDSEDKSTENAPEELCNFPAHVRLGGLAREERIALDELIYSSLVAMAKMVRARKISPVELAEAHLKRIKRVNPKLNAIVSMSAARIRTQAKAAEKAAASRSNKGKLGPLHGVPLTIKSSIDVAGELCECGTALRKGLIPQRDAPLVARLRAAGAIILGTTNVPEFLMAYESDNSLYGRTNNPWDLERTPGGSSGGEAAAIASGCSAGGVGSDGGGSVRIPAHFVGICGLKPTPGRIPSTGHFPASAGPFVNLGVVGPMARTVADVQRLFEVIAGPDPGDPASAPVPLRKWTGAEIRKLRIAYFEDDGATPVTPETAAAVRAAADALRQQGFKVEPWRPENLDRVWQLWWNLFGRAINMAFAPMLAGREAQLSPMYRAYRENLSREKPLSAGELLETQLMRDVLRNAFLAKMEKFPILLCPACAIPAFRHREHAWQIEGRKVEYLKAMSYSQWFNLLGNPAAVVPVGKSLEGLPIGVQVVGRPWEEEAVLAVAARIEQASGGFHPPPV